MRDDLRDFMIIHQGKLIGAFGGLLVALLIVFLGFWRSLFIFFCVILGIFIGWRFEKDGGPGEILERFRLHHRNRVK